MPDLFEEIMEFGFIDDNTVRINLLDERSNYGVMYGLNWGFDNATGALREENGKVTRSGNEAYFQLPPEVYRSDFFPKDDEFHITDDLGYDFVFARKQKPEKTALEIAESNRILGLYLRHRLGLKSGALITKNDLLNYGRTDIVFKKEGDSFYMDFSTDRNIGRNGRVINNQQLQQPDNEAYTHLLTALRTKPFVLLAGISGTGKSRIVRELAFKSCPAELQDADHTTPGNYCMIEVKPNWHDSTELLGYYSNISGKYMFTDFAKFLVKAMQHPDVPFFVCLDEMNLAPVEQYFAEFLSVLETRKMVDGHIVTGALVKSEWFTRKYEGGFDPFTEVGLEKIARTVSQNETDLFAQHTEASNEPYERQDIVDYLKEKGLTLPDNVFVIGTVNMDDTTHQFSRKVIDRAMTIEMNGGDLGAMFGGSAALNYLPEDKRWKIEFFRPRYVNADEVLAAHPDCAEQIKAESVEKIKSINTMLENTPFVVSYRVLNELVIYLGNLLDAAQYQGDGTDEIFVAKVQEAFDAITLMKILPRVEGDDELFDMKNDTQNRLQKMQELFTAENSGSHRKLQEMDNRLEQMQFTRFWP